MAAFPGDMLQMQVLRPHPTSTDSEVLGMELDNLYSDKIFQQFWCGLEFGKPWMRMSGAGNGDWKKVSDLQCNLLM